MMWVTATFHSASVDATDELGRLIGRFLDRGDVVALAGAMGSGKTQLTKGIARGLEVPEDEPVLSPTFVLVREYAGRLPLLHCDVYRLGAIDAFADLGLAEVAAEIGAVTVIEWADRFAELVPEQAWWIDCRHKAEQHREYVLRLPDEDHTRALCEAVRSLGSRPNVTIRRG
jgi:tRNA threonylcarbamoyladenosine biosynthesis protein TsaE